jgi:hypothetical protein
VVKEFTKYVLEKGMMEKKFLEDWTSHSTFDWGRRERFTETQAAL